MIKSTFFEFCPIIYTHFFFFLGYVFGDVLAMFSKRRLDTFLTLWHKDVYQTFFFFLVMSLAMFSKRRLDTFLTLWHRDVYQTFGCVCQTFDYSNKKYGATFSNSSFVNILTVKKSSFAIRRIPFCAFMMYLVCSYVIYG